MVPTVLNCGSVSRIRVTEWHFRTVTGDRPPERSLPESSAPYLVVCSGSRGRSRPDSGELLVVAWNCSVDPIDVVATPPREHRCPPAGTRSTGSKTNSILAPGCARIRPPGMGPESSAWKLRLSSSPSTAATSKSPVRPNARETERMVSWLFRNRKTGTITLAQPPNLSLIIFALLAAARWIFAPTGMAGTVVDVTASAAIAWWSFDELIRGVNPFRRMIGAGVLGWTIAGTGRALF